MTNYGSCRPYLLYSIVLFSLNSLQASGVGVLSPVLVSNLIAGYIKTPSTLVLFVYHFNHYLDFRHRCGLFLASLMPTMPHSSTCAVSVSPSKFFLSLLTNSFLFYLLQVATTVLDNPYESYRRVVERFPFAFADGRFADTSNWNIQRLGRELVTIRVSGFTIYSFFYFTDCSDRLPSLTMRMLAISIMTFWGLSLSIWLPSRRFRNSLVPLGTGILTCLL